MSALYLLALLTTALLLVGLARLFARWYEQSHDAWWLVSAWVCVVWSTVVVFGVIAHGGM